MTTTTEAMNKAREALEDIANLYEKNVHAATYAQANLLYDARCVARTALEEMSAALSSAEAQPVGYQMISRPEVFYPASHKPTDIVNFRPVFAAPQSSQPIGQPVSGAVTDEQIDIQAVRSCEHIGGGLHNKTSFREVRDFARHLVRALLSDHKAPSEKADAFAALQSVIDYPISAGNEEAAQLKLIAVRAMQSAPAQAQQSVCINNYWHPHDYSLTQDGKCAYCGHDEEAQQSKKDALIRESQAAFRLAVRLAVDHCSELWNDGRNADDVISNLCNDFIDSAALSSEQNSGEKGGAK